MHTLQSYDELPYERLSMPETEPGFLAALAVLHEFAATSPENASVLELGCAQGGNLIPMAARYPQGRFTGIDLSRVQVEEGQAFIRQAGLPNIKLLHGDIANLPEDLGQFDYIIAHGVYSWIPLSVREALLSACRKYLKPHGVAYISFNVEAGWCTYGKVRQTLLAQDDATLPPMRRVEQARRLLASQFFADEALDVEVQYLLKASPSYLFHEYLAEINQPVPFDEFVQSASANGLRYLGEAGPRRARIAFGSGLNLQAENRYERWLEAESNLDVAMNTRFRRALLVRADAPLPHPENAVNLKKLAFSAELTSEDELDFAGQSAQLFRTRTGEMLPVSHPLLKAFLMVLSIESPRAVAYGTALEMARGLACKYGYDGRLDEEFDEALLDFVLLHGARLHVLESNPQVVPADKPVSLIMARKQAGSDGWPVINAFHQALDMDEWGRWILIVLDGSVTQEELAMTLLARLRDAGIQAAPEQALEMISHYLDFFARQGLLQA